MSRRQPTIRYRLPSNLPAPAPGEIVMGEGSRTRGGYRVLGAVAVKSQLVGLGTKTWRLTVERISKATAEAEIAAGVPRWWIKWDARKKGANKR